MVKIGRLSLLALAAGLVALVGALALSSTQRGYSVSIPIPPRATSIEIEVPPPKPFVPANGPAEGASGAAPSRTMAVGSAAGIPAAPRSSRAARIAGEPSRVGDAPVVSPEVPVDDAVAAPRPSVENPPRAEPTRSEPEASPSPEPVQMAPVAQTTRPVRSVVVSPPSREPSPVPTVSQEDRARETLRDVRPR